MKPIKQLKQLNSKTKTKMLRNKTIKLQTTLLNLKVEIKSI